MGKFSIQAVGSTQTIEPTTVELSPPAKFPRIDKGTEQQEALWKELATGGGNVIAQARAGSGKSTSCREGQWRMFERHSQRKIAYAAFGKSNADEFRATCAPLVDVATLHSFGFSGCRKAFGSKFERNKSYLILDGEREGRNLPRYMRKSIALLASKAKDQNLDLPPDEKQHPTAFDQYAGRLAPLMIHYCINDYGRVDVICRWAARVLARAAVWTVIVDFDDMCWLPVRNQLTFPTCGTLFVDEAQDLSPIQHALIPLLSLGGRVVAVGDPYQAIFAWRGADAESMGRLESNLINTFEGCTSFPLTVTFRCPKSHVDLARKYVPDIEAHESNQDGEINYDVTVAEMLDKVQPGDKVICPTNAPVIKAALKLITRKQKVVVRGRDIGESMVEILHSCGDCNTTGNLMLAVRRWESRELNRLAEMDGVEDAVESVGDRAAGLQAILSACAQVTEVEPLIRSLFTADFESNAVNFSTVHRAKGSEAERIWFIDVPPRAPQREWEAQQQRNLRYVALTRSKSVLSFVQP